MLKKIFKFYLTALALAASGAATANDVYMEQIGSGNVINITQQGSGNVVNSGGVASTTKAYVNTQGATITVEQVGAQNTLSLVLNNPTMAAAGTGMNVTSTADGSGNEQSITCGTALSATCGASTITQNITGSNNVVSTTMSGGALSSIINLTGNYNQVTHTATGAGAHTADIAITGSGTSSSPNIVTLAQSGVTAKNVLVTSNGSNNNIAITQSD